VLPDNTKAFLHVLLEKEFPGDRTGLELPPERIHALLSEAFTGTQLYLESPQTFLANFLTFNTDTLTVNSEMLSRLSYIVDHPYFPEMIDEWLATQVQQGRKQLLKSEFEEFLSHVDRLVINYSSLVQLSDYFVPLFEFYGELELPRDIIHGLLTDKKLVIPHKLDRAEFTTEDLAFALKEGGRCLAAHRSC